MVHTAFYKTSTFTIELKPKHGNVSGTTHTVNVSPFHNCREISRLLSLATYHGTQRFLWWWH